MAKESAVMASVFLILLITYIIYIFMLHPWERVAIYSKAGKIVVSVTDCDTEYPIPNAEVRFYTSDGALLEEGVTSLDGLVSYESLPECFRIKASYSGDKYAGICIGDGEQRTVNLCFEDPTVNPDIIYSTEYVGVVGAMSGEAVSSGNYTSFALSYPIETASASYPDYYLLSNILWSERMGLTLEVNESITHDVALSFVLKSKKGNPSTVIKLSGVELFRDQVIPVDTVNVSIPKGLINETMDLSISCEFGGYYFWTTQDCELVNITVTQEYYLPVNTVHQISFDADSLEQGSSTAHLEFMVDKDTDSGVKAYINNYLVFETAQLQAINYEGSVNTELLNLADTGNSLRFELTPGGNASFSEVKLWFKAENATMNAEDLLFTVPADTLVSADYFEVHIYINEVLLGGNLILTLDDAVYETEVTHAGWTTIRLDKVDVDASNTLKLSARNAKFTIQDLRISYT